jgi:hypothetical protein
MRIIHAAEVHLSKKDIGVGEPKLIGVTENLLLESLKVISSGILMMPAAKWAVASRQESAAMVRSTS